MSFWNKSAKGLTYDDIMEFCSAKEHESEILEYRGVSKDMDGRRSDVNEKRLYRTVAAMANWWGGRILLGVDTRDGVPVSVPGCERKPHLEETIHQVCRARNNIYPPVVNMDVGIVDIPPEKHPEGKDCQAVVVIDVRESPHAPHRTDSDVYLYVRGQGINDKRCDDDFTKLATSGDEYWLLHRRAAAVQERMAHTETLRSLIPNRMPRVQGALWPRACVWAIPAYPVEAIVTREDLPSVLGRSEFPHAEPPSVLFGPPQDAYLPFRRTSRGLIREIRSPHYLALGVNLKGLVFAAWSLPTFQGKAIHAFEPEFACRAAAMLLCYALRVYRRVAYRGLLQVGLRLDDVYGSVARLGANSLLQGEIDQHRCLERGVLCEHEDIVDRLHADVGGVLDHLSTEWEWAYNFDGTEPVQPVKDDVVKRLPWDKLDVDRDSLGCI